MGSAQQGWRPQPAGWILGASLCVIAHGEWGVCECALTGLWELLPEGGTEGQTPPSAGRMEGWNLQGLWAHVPSRTGEGH